MLIITGDKYLNYRKDKNGRTIIQGYPEKYKNNLKIFLKKINKLIEDYCFLNKIQVQNIKEIENLFLIISGYRNPEYNKSIGGAKNSSHETCEACDFQDINGILKDFFYSNEAILSRNGLYMEHGFFTRGWMHLDNRIRNNIFFVPFDGFPKENHIDIRYEKYLPGWYKEKYKEQIEKFKEKQKNIIL